MSLEQLANFVCGSQTGAVTLIIPGSMHIHQVSKFLL